MNEIEHRLAIAPFFIFIAVGAIFYLPHWGFFLVVEMFILSGLNEFFTLAEKKGLIIHRGLGLFFGALLPFSAYISMQLPILLLTCVVLFMLLFRRRSPEHAVTDVAVSVFGIIYISWFLSYLMKIRLLPEGSIWVFYIVFIVKAGDVAAYFVGWAGFGKTKFIKHISPRKSIEGSIAQVVTTAGFSLCAIFFLHGVSLWHLLIVGIIVGFLALIGDFGESLLKRDADVKDSGQIPGLGGVLDIIDSLLLTVPFLYFYMTTVLGLEKS